MIAPVVGSSPARTRRWRNPLHHGHFRAPPGRAAEGDLVHEHPHQVDPSTIRLKQVSRYERIRNAVGVEATPLVPDPDLKLIRMERQLKRNVPILLFFVAVDDRVDEGFVDGGKDIVTRVLVQTDGLRQAVDESVCLFECLNPARDIKSNHHGFAP